MRRREITAPVAVIHRGRRVNLLEKDILPRRPLARGVSYAIEFQDGSWGFVERSKLNSRKLRNLRPSRVVGRVLFGILGRREAGRALGSLVRNR